MKLPLTRGENSLVNICLVFVLLFTVALKCGGPSVDDGTKPNQGELTETVVKQLIHQIEVKAAITRAVNPQSVTETFENIVFGPPRTANAADEYGGVPAGGRIYPVRTKYIVHIRRDGATDNDRRDYEYVFFKNKYNEWETHFGK